MSPYFEWRYHKTKTIILVVNFSECRDPVIWGVEILIQGIDESSHQIRFGASNGMIL